MFLIGLKFTAFQINTLLKERQIILSWNHLNMHISQEWVRLCFSTNSFPAQGQTIIPCIVKSFEMDPDLIKISPQRIWRVFCLLVHFDQITLLLTIVLLGSWKNLLNQISKPSCHKIVLKCIHFNYYKTFKYDLP